MLENICNKETAIPECTKLQCLEDSRIKSTNINVIKRKIDHFLQTGNNCTKNDEQISINLEPTQNEFEEYAQETFAKCYHFAHEKSSFPQKTHHKSTEEDRQSYKLNAAITLYVGEMYKFNCYKMQSHKQIIRSIYPTLSKINHSCDPNTIIT